MTFTCKVSLKTRSCFSSQTLRLLHGCCHSTEAATEPGAVVLSAVPVFGLFSSLYISCLINCVQILHILNHVRNNFQNDAIMHFRIIFFLYHMLNGY